MSDLADRKALGILLALASYGMYSLHYATMKWLVSGYSLWQLIFIRSVLTLAIAIGLSGRGTIAAAIASPYKGSTVFRAVTQVVSMWCFYTAASAMSLAEVTTLYSTAPLIIVVLSTFVLGETVRGYRWLAVALGFCGTAIAANPGGAVSLKPTLIGLASGASWAITVVLTRKNGARDSSSVQLFTTNIVFVLLSVALMTWTTPVNLRDCFVMIGLGVQIYLAQYFFFEACRFAPASLVGPLEYSSVVWACLLGFLIFADIPAAHVIIGATLVAAGGIALAASARNDSRRAGHKLVPSSPPLVATDLPVDRVDVANSSFSNRSND